MPLVEDIILAVVPVGEGGVVRAHLLDRLRRLNRLSSLLFRTFALLPPKLCLCGGLEVHPVRIDDLGLFLQVKGVLVVLDLC